MGSSIIQFPRHVNRYEHQPPAHGYRHEHLILGHPPPYHRDSDFRNGLQSQYEEHQPDWHSDRALESARNYGTINCAVSAQTAQAAPRQRTSIACIYCRQRKARCSGYQNTRGGKCQNCAKMNQECLFQPVSGSNSKVFVLLSAVQGGVPPGTQLYGARGQPLAPDSVPNVGQYSPHHESGGRLLAPEFYGQVGQPQKSPHGSYVSNLENWQRQAPGLDNNISQSPGGLSSRSGGGSSKPLAPQHSPLHAVASTADSLSRSSSDASTSQYSVPVGGSQRSPTSNMSMVNLLNKGDKSARRMKKQISRLQTR